MNVVTPYKNCIPGRGSTHAMHSVKVEAHRHYASISLKAELKVHVFLIVGHQQGCKVVTSDTSVKINVFFSRRVYDLYSFIAPRRGMPFTDGRWRGCSGGRKMFSVDSCQLTSGQRFI